MEILGITLTAWSSLIGALSMAILAVIMLILGTQRLHLIWSVFCIAVCIYAGGFYIIASISDPIAAQYWWKIEYIGTILIPFIFFHFILEFIGRIRAWLVAFIYLIGLTFVYLNLTTNLIIDQVVLKFGELYYNSPPGILHPFLIIVYGALILAAHYLLFAAYRSSKDLLFRARARFLLIATGVGFIGGSMNFLPVYGINIHPATNLTVIFGSSVVAFAILHYRLFNIRVVAAQLLTLILTSFALVRLILSDTTQEAILNTLLLALTFIVGVYLILSVRKEVEQREKLQKLSDELKEANARLTELDKLKSEFLAFASHQVKNPMAIVKGFAQLIYDGTYGPVSEKIRETAQKIKASADRMIALVNNLLDLRKIEEGKMEFKFGDVDIAALILSMVNEFKIIANAKNLALNFASDKPSMKIKADEEKIRQVIQNLMDNAIKYTEQGYVKVTVKEQGEYVSIGVIDTGRGMSPELKKQLFERFVRDPSVKREIQGTGLGLYIAKEIVTAHHGEIWAESDGEGQGSRFFLRLRKS